MISTFRATSGTRGKPIEPSLGRLVLDHHVTPDVAEVVTLRRNTSKGSAEGDG